jgi:hypothetical protein
MLGGDANITTATSLSPLQPSTMLPAAQQVT